MYDPHFLAVGLIPVRLLPRALRYVITVFEREA
jgi:hypothetical protein